MYSSCLPNKKLGYEMGVPIMKLIGCNSLVDL